MPAALTGECPPTCWDLAIVDGDQRAQLRSSLRADLEDMAAVFEAFLAVSQLKNDLVRQLDAQAQDVSASVNDEPGHEGYVGQGMKFVDRMRFSAANFARNNPELT